MRRVVLFTLVVLMIAAAGCQSKSESAPPAATAAPAAATAPASATPVATAAPGEIGIAECDDYIRKWESCLATKITGEVKEQTRVALDATREGWKRMAATPDGRAALDAACKEAVELGRMQVAAHGCTW